MKRVLRAAAELSQAERRRIVEAYMDEVRRCDIEERFRLNSDAMSDVLRQEGVPFRRDIGRRGRV